MENRDWVLESMHQSFRYAIEGFVRFEDERIIFPNRVVYVKAFEIVE